MVPHEHISKPAAGESVEICLDSGHDLMALGPQVFHSYVAKKFETALGHALPQLEVRYRNLTLAADVAVVDADTASDRPELPTIGNSLKKAVWQVAARRCVVRKQILKNVSGVFKPGSMTLVLGQPGSGKSSLMRVLSGHFPLKRNISLQGDMTYNGVPRDELLTRLPQFAAYITQRDTHFAALTVKETLAFANECCTNELATRHGRTLLSHGTPEQNAAAIRTAEALSTHSPDVMIEQLGLQLCQDTVLGDELHRGVSGGERKRVTTGEMQFGMKYAMFMDEISTGLDSAATFDIIETERSLAKKLHKTIVIALLQPTPEVFALFDDVLLLNDGEVMYHGPRDEVVEYFERLGFHCPPDVDAADYLLDLGTSQQTKYEVSTPGYVHPRLASEFADRFRSSSIHKRLMSELDSPYPSELLEDIETHIKPMPQFRQSFWQSTWTLTRRQMTITMRNTAFMRVRALMVVVMGLIYASTFYQFNPANAQVVLGVLFQTTMFLSLGQASQIPAFMTAREIFYKQRRANLYRTSSFTLACSVALAPQAAAESLVFGSLVYWMCGFLANGWDYLFFLLMMILSNMAFCAFFFLLTAICASFNVAKPMSIVAIVFFQVFAGFVVSRGQVAGYFVWIYWINPVSWCVRSLAVNYYRSATFDVCVFDGVNYCAKFGKTMGSYYLAQYDIPADRMWIWAGVLYTIFSYVFIMALACFILEYKRYDSPTTTIVTKKDLSGIDKAATNEGGDYALISTPRNSEASGFASEGEAAINVRPHEQGFTPVTLAFQDLWYSVPVSDHSKQSIDLLKGVSGYAVPGTMTALMGSSGAGKTTLMDVIAGRKTGGTIRGQILLNGYPATELAIRRCTGYCEQMDIHSEASTIREALTFSAILRQDSSVPTRKKLETVDECLDLLDLCAIADQIIRGSSQEQMKRLTIGVELAAQPSVLFLDEPTSGLDAHSAKVIMNGVRKVANSGRTIVCTIHQPSSDVFFLFDSLLLLKRGGKMVFFGDLGQDGARLISYFESIPDVMPLPEGQNPATWMLEVIGAGVTNDSAANVDFVEYFKASPQRRALEISLAQDGFMTPSTTLPELVFSKKRAADSMTQMTALVSRFMAMYWRTPSYNLTRLMIAVTFGLIFGIVSIGIDYTTYQGVNSSVGLIFMTTLYNGFASYTAVLPFTARERASFYRERAAQTYNSLWYWLGSTLAELPYVFCCGLLFTMFFFPIAGFSRVGTFVLYWIDTSLFLLIQTYMGQLLAYALPSVEVAVVVGVLCNAIFLLFAGYNPPADSIPSGYRWLYHITPHRYALSVLISLLFGDCPVEPTYDQALGQYVNVGSALGCQPLQNTPVTIDHITVKGYVEQVFQMKRDDLWSNLGVVLIFLAIYRALSLFALRYINHQKR